MVTLYDAPAEDLIHEVAADLEDRFDAPDWANFAKTGAGRELPPEQENFWHVRAASVLRKIATNGPVGVERLTTEYGNTRDGSIRFQVAPSKRSDASGAVIRTVVQQLEEEGLVEEKGRDGRVVTGDGRSLLDNAAATVLESLDRPDLERYA